MGFPALRGFDFCLTVKPSKGEGIEKPGEGTLVGADTLSSLTSQEFALCHPQDPK